MIPPTAAAYILVIFLAFLTAGAITSVVSVGKPRQPLTGGVAAVIVVVDVVVVVALITAILYLFDA